jgi:hypothetical protein
MISCLLIYETVFPVFAFVGWVLAVFFWWLLWKEVK